MFRIGSLAVLMAGLGLLAGGCSQQRVDAQSSFGDLRQADAPTEAIAPTIGAADTCGAVLWNRGMTSTAFLLRPGLPDALAVYGELEPAVVAAVPTP